MKVAELRKLLAAYSADQLRLLVVELYKALPKKAKQDVDLDELLRNPAAGTARKSGRRKPKTVDLGALRREIEEFLRQASAGLYVIPNRVVPKRERPKWRFQVMRFLKELPAAATAAEDVPVAAHLLEELYSLLCRGCGEYLFTTVDPFRSVRTPQSEFLDRVLTLRQAHESPRDFVRRGLTLATESELDRETLHSDLMLALLAHLRTPALREIAIDECERRLDDVARQEQPEAEDRAGRGYPRERYRSRRLRNNLAEMGFRCHLALADPEAAIAFFQRHWTRRDGPEVRLYVLLHLLAEHDLPQLWAREYDRAVAAGVRPREALQRQRLEHG
jgi:hypothetical protein